MSGRGCFFDVGGALAMSGAASAQPTLKCEEPEADHLEETSNPPCRLMVPALPHRATRRRFLSCGSLRDLPPTVLLGGVTDPVVDRQIQAIEQPDKALLLYYMLIAAVIPPAFPVLGPFLYFRYRTMRYKFSDDGISMSWGILFRRQIIVQYARIQDIHLKSNLVERQLGLARILIQTASGSSSAELTIEGIKEFEALRDFLYARMRGVKDTHIHHAAPIAPALGGAPLPSDEVAATLRQVVVELRAVREALEKRKLGQPDEPRHV
jgi:putative membrane protein